MPRLLRTQIKNYSTAWECVFFFEDGITFSVQRFNGRLVLRGQGIQELKEALLLGDVESDGLGEGEADGLQAAQVTREQPNKRNVFSGKTDSCPAIISLTCTHFFGTMGQDDKTAEDEGYNWRAKSFVVPMPIDPSTQTVVCSAMREQKNQCKDDTCFFF